MSAHTRASRPGRKGDRAGGHSWAQRIAAEGGLDVEAVQQVLLRAAALAVAEGIPLSAAFASRLIGLPDDVPVVSADAAVALAEGSPLEAQARLRRELRSRRAYLRGDASVRSLVERELDGLGVPHRERVHAERLLYELAALMPGEDVATELERVLNADDPVVRMPIREMVRDTGWASLEKWLSLTTFWWVAP